MPALHLIGWGGRHKTHLRRVRGFLSQKRVELGNVLDELVGGSRA